MKIRSDFVTNSSSSSFIAYGISEEEGTTLEISPENLRMFLEECKCEEKEIKEALKSLQKETPDEDYILGAEAGSLSIQELSEYTWKHSLISVESPEYYNFVGITVYKLLTSPETAEMKVKDLKPFVLEKLKILYPNLKLEDIQYIEEVWHN